MPNMMIQHKISLKLATRWFNMFQILVETESTLTDNKTNTLSFSRDSLQSISSQIKARYSRQTNSCRHK